MKRYALPVLILAIVASAANASSSINWKKGYAAAAAESKNSGKLIMIDFYTDWCGWCKKLDADTYPAPEVVKQADSFVSIKLNAEKDADGIRLARKFAVTGFPTILFLDAHENLAYKVVGYSAPKEFAASMAKAATIRQNSAKFKTALTSNPNDFDGLVGMAGIEASMGNVDTAAGYLDKVPKSVTGPKLGKLLDAYNAVGDGYQNSNKFDKAIGYFTKAISPSFPSQAAYARISIAVCYGQSGRLVQAKPYLQALLKMNNAPKEYSDQAKGMMQAIDSQGKK